MDPRDASASINSLTNSIETSSLGHVDCWPLNLIAPFLREAIEGVENYYFALAVTNCGVLKVALFAPIQNTSQCSLFNAGAVSFFSHSIVNP